LSIEASAAGGSPSGSCGNLLSLVFGSTLQAVGDLVKKTVA